MSLPEEERFRIATRLSPELVLKKLESVTQKLEDKTKNGKPYLGVITDHTFKITTHLNRHDLRQIPSNTQSWLKRMPGFIDGEIIESDSETVVNFRVQPRKAVGGIYKRLTALIILVVVPVIILFCLFLFLLIPYLFPSNSRSSFPPELLSLAVLFGIILLTMTTAVQTYKNSYPKFFALEKQFFSDLFEGQIR